MNSDNATKAPLVPHSDLAEGPVENILTYFKSLIGRQLRCVHRSSQGKTESTSGVLIGMLVERNGNLSALIIKSHHFDNGKHIDDEDVVIAWSDVSQIQPILR